MFTKYDIGLSVYSLRYGEGKIIRSTETTISAEFQTTDFIYTFCLNGKIYESSITPDLYFGKPEIIAPPRPKKKVMKTIERWAVIYSNGEALISKTKEDADYQQKYYLDNPITCVKLTGNYEVEE